MKLLTHQYPFVREFGKMLVQYSHTMIERYPYIDIYFPYKKHYFSPLSFSLLIEADCIFTIESGYNFSGFHLFGYRNPPIAMIPKLEKIIEQYILTGKREIPSEVLNALVDFSI